MSNYLNKSEFSKEINALIRAKSPLIYLVGTEEKRILEYFSDLAKSTGYDIKAWDCYKGLMSIDKQEKIVLEDVEQNLEFVESFLDYLLETEQAKSGRGTVYVMLDFYRFFEESQMTNTLERKLKTFSRIASNTSLILTGPYYASSPSLEKEVRVVDFPAPNKEEVKGILYEATGALIDKRPNIVSQVKANEELIINAVNGLTEPEISSAFAKSIAKFGDFKISALQDEKKEVIRKTGMLEYLETDITVDDLGGLENLIQFLRNKKVAFSQEAIDFGLSSPKGIVIFGPPGTGKSLVAKAASSILDMPVLKLDFGSLFGAHVGQSERNTRELIKLVERLAPAILFIDELDKGLAGAKSSGETDSGVTSRVIGTLLNWMQEKKVPIFLICTANNHESIPPEFIRAGRFDELFFVELPTQKEREAIIQKLIKRKNRKPDDFDTAYLASISTDQTGAELEKAIENALLVAFQKKKDLATDDITIAIKGLRSLSIEKKNQIEKLKAWAASNCVPASIEEKKPSHMDRMTNL